MPIKVQTCILWDAFEIAFCYLEEMVWWDETEQSKTHLT